MKEVKKKPSRMKRSVRYTPYRITSSKSHELISKYDDDNVGNESMHKGASIVQDSVDLYDERRYQKKRKAYKKQHNKKAGKEIREQSKLQESLNKTYEKVKKKAKETFKDFTKLAFEYVKEHAQGTLLLLVIPSLLMILMGSFSGLTVVVQGGGSAIVGTTFSASDEDILGVDEDYCTLETELRNRMNSIESTYSGYDEYEYERHDINHNPFELVAYLTVKYGAYQREDVQDDLTELLEKQYKLTLTNATKTKDVQTTDPATGNPVTTQVQINVLKVKLVNYGLSYIIRNIGLTDEELEMYDLLLAMKGNRSDLFADNVYAYPLGEYTNYTIPSEALTNVKFANMMQEATKYLGYPYVYGGSNPATSFDCSGFVCWVINHSNNGWNVGRTDTNGLVGRCDIIPRSSAKPGDLIFFQGTYNYPGASHVGIYVGDGVMIHCGNPIQYANINDQYWVEHFYCFGRLKG